MGARPDAPPDRVSGADIDRVAILVHEVRSPVAALVAVAEAIRDTTDKAVRAELVGLAGGACSAIERIVSDIAVASVRTVPTDARRLVHELVAVKRLAGAVIAVEIEDDLPLVEADPVRLRQALENLVANALTHAGDDSTIVVRASSTANGGVALSVADSGAGIPRDELEHIFDRGVRLDDSRPGSGLGLALARAIVDAHAGTLSVESTLGLGTTFTIVLPPTAQPATRG